MRTHFKKYLLPALFLLSLLLFLSPTLSLAEDFSGTWVVYESHKDLMDGKLLSNRTIHIGQDGNVDFDIVWQDGTSFVGQGKLVKNETYDLTLPNGEAGPRFYSLDNPDALGYVLYLGNHLGLQNGYMRRINKENARQLVIEMLAEGKAFTQNIQINLSNNTLHIDYGWSGGVQPYICDLETSVFFTESRTIWFTDMNPDLINDGKRDFGVWENVGNHTSAPLSFPYWEELPKEDVFIYSIDYAGRIAENLGE